MNPRSADHWAWILLVSLGVALGGCNVFGDRSPSAETVPTLVADARTALTRGDASRAVQLLERALHRDSTHLGARIALANALYAEQDLDVFTLRAASTLVSRASSSTAGPRTVSLSPRNGRVCIDGARPQVQEDRYVTVPLEADAIRRLQEHASVVERVQQLVVEGVLRRRASSFSDASLRLRQQAWLLGAFTVVADGILRVREAVLATESTLYVDEQHASGPALIACAPDEDALAVDRRALCQLGSAAQQAIGWLRRRSELLGSDRTSVLLDPVQLLEGAASARTDCSASQ